MDSLGQRLATIRHRRRLSQQDLADTAAVSVDVIRKLEQGQRHTARLDSLVRLANALDVPIAELIGKQPGLPNGQDAQIRAMRQAILGRALSTDEPPPTSVQRQRIGELWRLYWRGRYAELARELPTAIGQARASIRAAEGGDDRAAHAVLAELLQIGASMLAHLVYEDLAHVALGDAIDAAERADQPLLRGAQLATRTWILARQGLWSEAEHLAVTAAGDVEPRLSTASPDQLAVWGELLRYGVTAVARDGRRAEAEELLGMVQAAAAAMGDRKPTLTGVVPFGPTIAGMAAVGIAVATDEPRRALDLAGRVGDIATAPLAIQARYLLNVAYAQTMAWESVQAVDTLRRVDTLAPELLPHQTIARAIVDELLPRRAKVRLPGLVEIADRVGATAR